LKSFIVNFPLIALVLFSGCYPSNLDKHQIDQIVLDDLHVRHGGRIICISGDGNATALRVVWESDEEEEDGFREYRYTFQLSSVQLNEIFEVLDRQRFLQIRTISYYVVPPCTFEQHIMVRSGKNKYKVSKWSFDTHRQFDTIYRHLIKIVEAGKHDELIDEGSYEHASTWSPALCEDGNGKENRYVKNVAERFTVINYATRSIAKLFAVLALIYMLKWVKTPFVCSGAYTLAVVLLHVREGIHYYADILGYGLTCFILTSIYFTTLHRSRNSVLRISVIILGLALFQAHEWRWGFYWRWPYIR
jgi:hypothetical protein